MNALHQPLTTHAMPADTCLAGCAMPWVESAVGELSSFRAVRSDASRAAMHATLDAVMPHAPYILLVEDNPGDAHLTRTHLAEGGQLLTNGLHWVQTLQAAVHTLETAPGCQVVLLDLGLPDGQGLDTLQAIRPCAQDCPIVVLTGEENETVGMMAVADGAQDYLVKGSFDAGLLRRCLSFAAHRKRAERALLLRAFHDELTGLPRRALLMDRLQEAIKRARRGEFNGALLFIDLDRFKQTNDKFGHEAGDAVLCTVARRLREVIRDSDTAARLGGDEFVVLLPMLKGADDALVVARKIRSALELPLEFHGHTLTISASIGIAEFRDNEGTAQELMGLADSAMYQAKASGQGVHRLS